MLDSTTKKQLAINACKVRIGIVEGVFHAHSGHPGGSLSIAEALTWLYHKELRVDPKNPKDPNRDRFVLSKGHCAPGLYAVLAQMGYFAEDELKEAYPSKGRHAFNYQEGKYRDNRDYTQSRGECE